MNLDLGPAADVQADVTRGLPYENGSVRGVFSEHFIEHLTQAQGASFFRECRRVLENGGRVRVATPDLDFLVDVYSTDWRRNMPE
ncbi:MAG: class I SAM-dependent methyltransferase, partial [Candidatus Eiseniibacteriota bacterium]